MDTTIRTRIKIGHPLADEVSMISNAPDSMYKMAQGNYPWTVELAFFRDGEWVPDIIPDFREYAIEYDDTPTYAYVPLPKVLDWLRERM